jgi:hypothetical protein
VSKAHFVNKIWNKITQNERFNSKTISCEYLKHFRSVITSPLHSEKLQKKAIFATLHAECHGDSNE